MLRSGSILLVFDVALKRRLHTLFFVSNREPNGNCCVLEKANKCGKKCPPPNILISESNSAFFVVVVTERNYEIIYLIMVASVVQRYILNSWYIWFTGFYSMKIPIFKHPNQTHIYLNCCSVPAADFHY